MAGTVTVVETTHTSVKKIVWTWTATAGGAADLVTTKAYDGKIIGLTTIPSAVTAPTADYDITVTDIGAHDVLLGAGANRHTTNTEHVAEASLGAVAGSPLTLNVAAAGNAGKGVTILWLR